MVAHKLLTSSGATTHFDICIFCALAEEASVCIREIERLCSTSFQSGFSVRTGAYYTTIIRNSQEEVLSVRISWQSKPGPVEAGLHIKPVLAESTPYFAVMTGICGAIRGK